MQTLKKKIEVPIKLVLCDHLFFGNLMMPFCFVDKKQHTILYQSFKKMYPLLNISCPKLNTNF